MIIMLLQVLHGVNGSEVIIKPDLLWSAVKLIIVFDPIVLIWSFGPNFLRSNTPLDAAVDHVESLKDDQNNTDDLSQEQEDDRNKPNNFICFIRELSYLHDKRHQSQIAEAKFHCDVESIHENAFVDS